MSSVKLNTEVLSHRYTMNREALEAEAAQIEEAKRNPQAFAVLYDRYFESIFRFVFRRTDDEEITHDLTSQTFMKALQGVQKYEDRGVPFSAWLFRIAGNEVNKHYRKTQHKQVFSLEEVRVKELMAESGENANEELIAQMVRYLGNLPTDMVEVLELRFFEDKSFKEIAFILDITESGAKMRVYRALDKLRVHFQIKVKYNE
jgi:RNA polymerase sigma-70 factor, ECF subfamily